MKHTFTHQGKDRGFLCNSFPLSVCPGENLKEVITKKKWLRYDSGKDCPDSVNEEESIKALLIELGLENET